MTYTLHLGDCLEFMRGLPDGCIDAVITDPPYNVSLAYRSYNDTRESIAYAEWCGLWFAECKRIAKRAVAISVGQSNLSLWATIAPPDWWLAWWKPAAMGRCVIGFNNWEPIAVYGKAASAGSDVLRAIIKPSEDVGDHPCPKPIEWAKKQINMFSHEGETIFDPFTGSGTTGLACQQMGRSFIGCEIDPAYHAIATRRIEAAAAQGIFDLTTEAVSA